MKLTCSISCQKLLASKIDLLKPSLRNLTFLALLLIEKLQKAQVCAPVWNENYIMNLEVGITPQPYAVTGWGVDPPDCLDPNNFIRTFSPSWFNGNYVSGVTLALEGNHGLQITICSINLIPNTCNSASRGIIISDPCKRAIIQNPFSTFTVDVPITLNAQQGYSVYTDVTVNCGTFTVSMPPADSYGSQQFGPLSHDDITNQFNLYASQISLPNHIGTHEITMNVESVNYSSHIAKRSFTFIVEITCTVQYLNISTSVTDFTYTLNSGTVFKGPFSLVQANNDCKWNPTWEAFWEDNGTWGPLPSLNSFDVTSLTFSFYWTQLELIGTVQRFQLRATIQPTYPSNSLPMSVSHYIQVTIQSPCYGTSFVDRTFDDYTIIVGDTGSLNIGFEDSAANAYLQPNLCGPRSYNFTGGLRSWLTFDSSNNYLVLQNIGVPDVDTHEIPCTVTLQNYPARPSQNETFRFIIGCVVQTATLTATPEKMFFEPGVTPQPMIQTVKINPSPNCSHSFSFEWSYQFILPTFVFVTNNAGIGTVKVQGAVLANQGQYSLDLQYRVNNVSVVASFQIEISDPCKRAIFQADSPLVDMALMRNFDEDKTQTFYVQTDIETDFNLVCSYVASLVSPPTFVSLVADPFGGDKIYVTSSQTTDQDAVSHLISVLVISANYPATVSSVTYTFLLNVQNCVVNTMIIDPKDDFDFMLHQGPTTFQSFLQSSWSNLDCLYQVTYTATYDGSSILPTWFTLDGADFSVTLDPRSKSDVGIHEIILTATIPQPSHASGVKQVSTSFKLTVVDDCEDTYLVNRSFPVIYNYVALPQPPIDIFLEDIIAISHTQPNYCGPRNYNFWPPYEQISIQGDTLIINTNSVNEVGDYYLEIIVLLPEFNTGTGIYLEIKVECVLTGIERIMTPPLKSQYRIKVDGKITLPFQFQETPLLDQDYSLEYSLEPSLPFVTFSTLDGAIYVDTDDFSNKGLYVLKIIVKPSSPCSGLTSYTQFELEMVNLCETTNFDSQLIPDIKLFKQDPNFKAQEVIKFEDFRYDALSINQIDCGSVKTEIKVFNSTETPPDWIQLSGNSINVDFSGLDKPIGYKLNLFAFLEQYPDRGTVSTFYVSLSASELKCLPNAPQEFQMDQFPLQFGIQFMNKTSTFGLKLTPVIQALAFDIFGRPKPLPGFVNYNAKFHQFKINSISEEDVGQFFVGLSLAYTEYPGFEVICQTKLTLTSQPTKNEKEKDKNTDLAEEQQIDQESQAGSASSQQPNEEELAQEEQRIKDLLSRLFPKPKQSKTINLPLILNCKEISESGVITMVFNRPVQLNSDYFFEKFKKGRHLQKLTDIEREYVYEMLQNAFIFEFRPKSELFKPELINFNVTDFRKGEEIDIQIVFNEPLFVSFESESNNRPSMDQIYVSLKDAQMFIDPIITAPITPALLQKEKVAVPRQEPIEKAAAIELAEATTQAMVTALAPSTLIVNLLLGVSLKKLWSAVNLLQFVTYVNLWKVSLPANLENFFKKASFFARGDWIPKKRIIGLFNLNAKGQEDQQGLQTRFLILIFVVLVILTILIAGMICVCKSYSAKIVRFCQDQKQKIFWNAIIRFSLQSYLDFAVTISLKIALGTEKQDAKFWINLALLLIIAVAPIGYFILLHKKFNSLRKPELKIKIGTLYQSINLKSYPAVCYNVVFFARRMIFALITTFVGSFDGGLTVSLVVIELILFSIYLAAVKPQETRVGNRVELVSEVLLTYCFFGMMVCLSTTEPKQQYFVGWLSVTTIITLVLICVCYLASDSVLSILQWLKKKIVMRRRQLEIERRIKEAELAQQEINETRVAVKVNPFAQEISHKIQDSSQPQQVEAILIRKINRNPFFIDDDMFNPSSQIQLKQKQRFYIIKKLSISSDSESVNEESKDNQSIIESSYGSQDLEESKAKVSYDDQESMSESRQHFEKRLRQLRQRGISKSSYVQSSTSSIARAKRLREYSRRGFFVTPNVKPFRGINNDEETNQREQNQLRKIPSIIPLGELNYDLPLALQGNKMILQNPKVIPIRGVNNFAETAKVSPRQTDQQFRRSPIFISSLNIDSLIADDKQEDSLQMVQRVKAQFSMEELQVQDSGLESLCRRYYELKQSGPSGMKDQIDSWDSTIKKWERTQFQSKTFKEL